PPLISTLFPYTTLFRSTVICGMLNEGRSTDGFHSADSPPAPRNLSAHTRGVNVLSLSTPAAIRAAVNDASKALASRSVKPRSLRSEEHTSELQSPYDLV